jgi:type I restriction enzyme S subunit
VIEDLKPYTETRDSGLPWLGVIPAHWEIKRNGSLFQQRNAVGEPDWPILEVSLRTGVRIREFGSSKRKQVISDKAKYKCATKGDFVYNMMRMWQGAAGIAPVDGLVSPAYVVAKPLPHTNPAYFASLFRTDDYLAEIDAFSRGIVKDRNRLYWDQFKQIPTPCPPPKEQAAIARFLAWATNRLDRAIGAKRRIIALLQEQKQAIIHRAVTRGLDPSVPLKDSGIPWLGEIPEHWEIANLGRLCIARCDGPFGSGLKSSHYTDAGVRVIRLQNIGIGEFKDGDRAYIAPEHYDSLGDHDVVAGDLLVAGLGDERVPAGRSCLAPPNCEPAMVKADCFRFRMKKNHNIPQFVAIQLSATAHAATSCLSTGATRLRINLSASSARSVALPPGLEQQAILHHMEKKTSPLSSAISRLESEITLLREYRTRLIADVVTGKLDVREVAKGLPEGELQDQPDVEAVYDAEEAEDDAESDPIDTVED